MSFEKYAELTKEQYPDFDFTDYEIEEAMVVIDGYEEDFDLDSNDDDDYFDFSGGQYKYFSYRIPRGYMGVIFSKNDNKVFFMIDVRGLN